MEKKYFFTFHFVSGKEIKVYCSEERKELFINSLLKHWNETTTAGNELGINFSLVTHYEITEE